MAKIETFTIDRESIELAQTYLRDEPMWLTADNLFDLAASIQLTVDIWLERKRRDLGPTKAN